MRIALAEVSFVTASYSPTLDLTFAHRWINYDIGHRSDTAHNYVYNQASNKNLHVVTGANVKRVLFE